MPSAQQLLDDAYEAPEGHVEQTLYDGRTIVATSYGEELIVKDFRKTTAVWTETHVTFDELRAIIDADLEAEIDRREQED